MMRQLLRFGFPLLFLAPLAARAEAPFNNSTEIEKVAGDFAFTEGPASDGKGNLYFTDIPNNKILRVDAAGKLTTFTAESGHANGLMFNGAGELLACEMDGQLVAWKLGETPERRVVAAGYEGKRFNAPNDLVVDRSGGVYMTDPHFRAPEPLPQGKTCVYYIDSEGKVSRLIDNLPAPNGVLLSPDEKTLYVVPSGQSKMMAYLVESPGKLGEGRVLCELKQPEGVENTGGDGLTVDKKGNLYITSRLGIQVVSPEGKLLGILAFPEQPANCTFGGPGNAYLYVTARNSLYRAKLNAEGHVFPGK